MDINISPAELALYGSLMGTVAGALSLVFRLLLEEKNKSYDALRAAAEQRDQSRLVEIQWLQAQLERVQTTQASTLQAILAAVQARTDPGRGAVS